MNKQVRVEGFGDLRRIVNAAAGCLDEIGVQDRQGAVADARSILALMRLDYTGPVELIGGNERELASVCRALAD